MNEMVYIYILLLLNIIQIKSGSLNIIDPDNSEEKYNNDDYINSYKIPSNLMIFISNGKELVLHSLKKAFDGDFDTYWQSYNQQEEGFINNIVITFSRTVSFDRILYKAPTVNETEGNGYPIEF